MKELLEQYKRIQGIKECLRSFNKYAPDIISDKAIDVIIDRIDLKLDSLAHEIAVTVQQQVDADANQAVKGPEPINNVLHKPLWAVLPADAEDDVWQKQLGPRKQLSYQLFLAQSHAEEYSAQLRKSKVVPVWGQ